VKRPGPQQLSLAVSCLVGVLVAVQNTKGFDGTEFGGGWLTGPLLSIANIGILLFLLALIAAFVLRRVAAGIGFASSVLCLPLYLYLIAPVLFIHVFGVGHKFKVQPSSGFHGSGWAIAGVLTLAATMYVCVRNLAVPDTV
jgi:hypothetical protein